MGDKYPYRVTRSISCPKRLGAKTEKTIISSNRGRRPQDHIIVSSSSSSSHEPPIVSSSSSKVIDEQVSGRPQDVYPLSSSTTEPQDGPKSQTESSVQNALRLENEMLHRKLIEKDAQIFLLKTSQQPHSSQWEAQSHASSGPAAAASSSVHPNDASQERIRHCRNTLGESDPESEEELQQFSHHDPTPCTRYFRECRTMFEYLDRITSIRFKEVMERIDHLSEPREMHSSPKRRSQSVGPKRPSGRELQVYGEPWLEGNRLRRNSELLPEDDDDTSHESDSHTEATRRNSGEANRPLTHPTEGSNDASAMGEKEVATHAENAHPISGKSNSRLSHASEGSNGASATECENEESNKSGARAKAYSDNGETLLSDGNEDEGAISSTESKVEGRSQEGREDENHEQVGYSSTAIQGENEQCYESGSRTKTSSSNGNTQLNNGNKGVISSTQSKVEGGHKDEGLEGGNHGKVGSSSTSTLQRSTSSIPERRGASSFRVQGMPRRPYDTSASQRLAKAKKNAPVPSLPASKSLLTENLDKISKGIIDFSGDNERRSSKERYRRLSSNSSSKSVLHSEGRSSLESSQSFGPQRRLSHGLSNQNLRPARRTETRERTSFDINESVHHVTEEDLGMDEQSEG